MIAAWREVQPEASARQDAELIGVLYDGRSNQEAVEHCIAFASRYPSSPLLPGVALTEFRLAVAVWARPRPRVNSGSVFLTDV